MPPPQKSRIQSVDALRGFVMIIMALDHVREFFHADAFVFQPEDLTRTTPVLFFTRWITHICAPTFMFTAGLGAYLWFQRGHTRAELSRFLWTRGLWLIILEFTALRLAFNFGLTEGFLLLSVLWALGWSMVALSVLSRLPLRILAVLSVAAIALHNLADPIRASSFGGAAWIWNVLHQPGLIRAVSMQILLAYPLIPWIFVMAAGFCFGPILQLDPPRRRQLMLRTGLALIAAFVAIRTLNIYGDPVRWTGGVLSFLRCTKYPPSLDFLLMTLGPALVLMAFFDRFTFSKSNPLIVFGRVPLFYFLGHIALAHAFSFPLAWFRYGRVAFLFHPLPTMGGTVEYPQGYGYPLWAAYAVWVAVVAAIYPACLWFARVKERSRSPWLSYL